MNLFLDGRFALSLGTEIAADLVVGQELSEDEVQALSGSDGYRRCLDAAAHYLSYRPRSAAELRERLQRRGFDSDNIEKVLGRLREQELVDDASFARFWAENREQFSPRSRALTRLELRQKGVAADIIGSVLGDADDADSAYRAAAARLRGLPADYPGFRSRLGQYLKRRGFSYGVISNTVRRLWHEQTSDTSG